MHDEEKSSLCMSSVKSRTVPTRNWGCTCSLDHGSVERQPRESPLEESSQADRLRAGLSLHRLERKTLNESRARRLLFDGRDVDLWAPSRGIHRYSQHTHTQTLSFDM